ncbi:la protein homolog [Bombus vosnesenskii]|uniref:La protein homolog n=1 Tax=Bombus vosnesenskii TaxID=207650 RepID=A0A6J3KFL9_9HYME|nr:la protein homolog [Bombus vosnesenskii]
MENGQGEAIPQTETQTEIKTKVVDETKINDTNVEVKDEKPVSEELSPKVKSEEPSSELLERIKNQVEFYFGDVNMQRDKFLIEQTKLDEGWVPMTIMLNFKLLASMSQDINVILEAIKSSELMEISEDRKKIRRSPKHPLPIYNEEYRKAQEAKTVYVKGFPLQDTTIEKLKTFFSAYEPVDNIVMRKYMDKEKKLQFKGSIFVQFKTLEDAKAFMVRESVKYGDTELIKMWSSDYYQSKTQEREGRRQRRSEIKAKKSESVDMEFETTEYNDKEKEGDKVNLFPKGCVIYFTNVPDECIREDIKECLGELGANVAFVDFNKGDAAGYARLQGENDAKTVIDKMHESKISIRGKDVTCCVLESEEEEKYFMKVRQQMANSRQRNFKGKRGKKGRNTRVASKRRMSESSDVVPAKRGNNSVE